MPNSLDRLKTDDIQALEAMSQNHSNPVSAILAHIGNNLFHEDKTQEERELLFSHLKETLEENPNLISEVNEFDGHTPIIDAAGSLKATKLLVEKGANIDFQSKFNGLSAIENSITVGRKDVTQYLIDQGAKINTLNLNGDNLLHTIAGNHQDKSGTDRNLLSITQLLLSKEVIDINHMNNDGKTPLDIANDKEMPDLGTTLRKSGALTSKEISDTRLHDLETLNHAPRDIHPLISALHLIENGEIKTPPKVILEHIIKENNIDVNQTHDAKGTPAIIYAARGSAEATKFLIDKGVDINAKNVEGITPIMSAVGYGQDKIVNLLIENGAKTNQQDNQGNNLFHKIADDHFAKQEADNIEKFDLHNIAENLLKKEPKIINQKNKEGKTPLDIALDRNAYDLVGLLSENGAKTAQELEESKLFNKIFSAIKNVINKVISIISSVFGNQKQNIDVKPAETQKSDSKQLAISEKTIQNSKNIETHHDVDPQSLGNLSPKHSGSNVIRSTEIGHG